MTRVEKLVSILLCVAAVACTQGSASDGPLTYYKDIKPIVDAKCVNCHTTGGIAPFALNTAEQVVQYKALIKADVQSKTMPPWPPSDACNSYKDDHSLSDAQIDTIAKWVDAGAAVGTPDQTPKQTQSLEQKLSRVDFNLKLPEAYTPKTSPDEYRCFLVDWPETTTKYITGYNVRPGDARIVHHLIAFLATPDLVDEYQALDDAEPGPGYTCFGGPGGTSGSARIGWIGTWAPGGMGGILPAGTGLKVEPGSKVVIQMHYNTSTTKPVPDQSSIDFMVEDSVNSEAFIMPFTNPQWIRQQKMSIAAGDKDAMHSFDYDISNYLSVFTRNTFTDGVPFTIHSAALHMHTRGTHATASVIRAGGTDECMLDIPKWDFHWQGAYLFEQPKLVQPGDKLHLECHWDNSAANQPFVDGRQQDPADLNWGEGTSDEMCLGIFYVTQ